MSPETLGVIRGVAARLSPRHAFGYHTVEDIEQECVAWGLQMADRCPPGRPLDDFLAVHIKNRLLSFKRDWIGRHERPLA